jgi:cyclic-di-AMP phosphodiesterase PgpH
MGKESGRTVIGRGGARRSTRRGRLGRSGDSRSGLGVADFLRSRALTWGALVTIVFGLIAGLLSAWSREQTMLTDGMVATKTRSVRVTFRVEDVEQTASAREQARQQAKRVFQLDEALVDELRGSMESLPRTLAGVAELDGVDEGIRARFRLTAEGLAAVRAEAAEGEPSESYRSRVARLIEGYARTPVLDAQTWQRVSQGLSARLELRRGSEVVAQVHRDSALSVENTEALRARVAALCEQAGLVGALRDVMVARLAVEARPNYRLDTSATAAAQDEAAAAVEPRVNEWPAGAVIYTRGDVLSSAQVELSRAEQLAFQAQAESWRVWVRRVGVVASALAISVGGALYAFLFCPRLRKKVSRMVWIASLLATTLGVACVASLAAPAMVTITAVVPTVFVAAILVIAYDQRVGLAYSVLHALLVCIALDQPIGMLGLIMTGVTAAVWQLRDIRSRDALIRMGVATGAALAIATLVVVTLDRPMVAAAIRRTAWDAFWAGVGGLSVGAVVMFVLPLIERAFDITTGMTLIELRDPKQPLLRELQQRAPGSYNHSLNVATIAEAGAAAIGADTLLTYAGALYHDIGKMNKPEYFVENQQGGLNKHDKLSPAMSLLVIVGHVKDGMEMAREYGLPRCLQHFIEAHHGTTLVEYFYHRARKRAEDSGEESGEKPRELEYRYPGPKPRTKEVAILMVADAVESATRTLAEPTPARIDQLVREIANKRLLDGQFDECDLTLRELKLIVEAISKSLASSYHGRVVYPEAGEGRSGSTPPRQTATR